MKGGEKTLKKIAQLFVKFGPALASCLVAVAALNANSATSFFFHQPEVPKSLDKFRRFK